ncbi:MAG TPA: response regulator [Thermoanaerobaculales bacterium]|nr:response regulator [Thermoanaerobaculales bacterium]
MASVLLKSRMEAKVRPAAAALGIRGLPLPSPPGLMRLLLVDPDRSTREAVAAWSSDHPWIDVDVFASAQEALTRSTGVCYDLCLLDYALDGVDGVMLGAMIRTLNPAAQLVLMCEAVSGPLEHSAVEHGFQAVLAKPLGPPELDRVLGRLTR